MPERYSGTHIKNDIVSNWRPVDPPSECQDEFWWLLAMTGINYDLVAKVDGPRLWDDYRFETIHIQECKMAAMNTNKGDAFHDAGNDFRKQMYAFLKDEERIKRLRITWAKNRERGLLGYVRDSSNLSLPIWNSPTQVNNSLDRGHRIAEWLSNYKNIYDGTLIEMGSAADFIPLAIAKMGLFQRCVGVDILSVRDAMGESSMKNIRKIFDIDTHLQSLAEVGVEHITASFFEPEKFKDILSILPRPHTLLFSRIFQYFTSPVIEIILKSSIDILQPDFIAVYEALERQGLTRKESSKHIRIYKT